MVVGVGVVWNSDIFVSALTVRLFYFLRENNKAENDDWLHGFTQVFSNLSDELNKVSTVYYILQIQNCLGILPGLVKYSCPYAHTWLYLFEPYIIRVLIFTEI